MYILSIGRASVFVKPCFFFLWVVSIYLCSHLPCTFDGWLRILDFYLRGFSSDKTPSLEEPSPAITARLEMGVTCAEKNSVMKSFHDQIPIWQPIQQQC